MGNLAGEQSLFGEHDDAVQRSPDLQGATLAQQPHGGGLQRFHQEFEGLHRRAVQLAAFRSACHGSRREHQTIDAVAAQAEIKRELREARQLRLLRWFFDRRAHHRAELAERFGRHSRQQRFAIGKMLIGRRLRDAEFLGKRADADRLGAA